MQQEQLKNSEELINRLQEQATNTNNAKFMRLDSLQKALESRIKLLEEMPKTKTLWNGKIAFVELLSFQRDIQPAKLFSLSVTFFNDLGSICNVQQYSEFTDWEKIYREWSKDNLDKHSKKNNMLSFFNNSINLLNTVSSPYSSLIQIASSGVGEIINIFRKDGNKPLTEKTPEMLQLLTSISQFENQKIIIDSEWDLITKELKQLISEDTVLLKQQLKYYGINEKEYIDNYEEASTATKRSNFEKACKDSIDKVILSKEKWTSQVESYMYRVQSLRIRFGELTNRMLINIERYEILIHNYTNNSKLPASLVQKIQTLEHSLKKVKDTFNKQFNPRVYIEESAVMYIENQ